eukprot:scaffold85518_cov37-Tisochrysis_lutea.AAC.5
MKDTFDGKSSGEGRIPRGKKGPNIHVGYEGQSAWRKVQLLSRTATTRSRRRLEGRWLHVQALPHEAWMKDPRMRYTCRKRTKSNLQRQGLAVKVKVERVCNECCKTWIPSRHVVWPGWGISTCKSIRQLRRRRARGRNKATRHAGQAIAESRIGS